MPLRALIVILFLATLPFALPARAQGFKFSQPDTAAQQEEAARQERIAAELSTPCRADLKGRKIMVMIGEVQDNGYVSAQQQNYGPHFQAINARLRSLGLATYTPEEIRKQIAQAEIDAYFRNDPDAALAAAKRLGASFILRGLISSQAARNAVIPINQVTINMGFTLSAANGRIISDVGATASSYAGTDVARMALTLVEEQADEVVARLYGDYCRNAGFAAGGKPAKK
jgi:hypothetical protein